MFLLLASLALSVDVLQYHVHEVVLTGKSPSNPFMIEFNATITASDGGKSRHAHMVIPGFYDGNGTWKVRFAPDVVGAWQWTTSSNLRDLDGKSGSVNCVPNTNTNVHGALLPDKQYPHHFVYQDGTRYFMLGYECDWMWALDLPGVKATTHLDTFIANATSYGFNHFLVNIYAKECSWSTKVSPPARVAPTTLTPWKDNDQSMMDVVYWQHFDEVVAQLQSAGAIAHLYLTVWNKGVDWPTKLSPEDDLYWRYVAARYQAYSNVVWDISKEANRVSDTYWANRMPYLRGMDGHLRMMTAHTHCPVAKYCDMFSAQQHSNYYQDVVKGREQWPGIPYTNVEFMYEVGPIPTYNKRNTSDEIRPVMWDLYMAGGYMAYNYADTAWDVILPNYFPGASYCKILKSFWENVVYYHMSPDDSAITLKNGVTGHCRCLEGKEYVIYLHDSSSFDLSIKSASKKLSGYWFDPKTGKQEDAKVSLGNGAHTLTPPTSFTGDVALHLH